MQLPVHQKFLFLQRYHFYEAGIPDPDTRLPAMLRKTRIVLAAIFFTLITMLFLDFTGTLHAWFGWMAKIQFLPALLAVNAGIVIILVILTLLCGRVYCSVICPLGVFQDIVSWINGVRGKKHRMRFSLSPAKSAQVWCSGSFHHCFGCRDRFVRCPARPVQRIRAHCLQPVRPPLPVGQQSAGIPCGKDRQLCILQQGCLDKKHSDILHSCSHLYRDCHPCLEKRQDMVQHHLPRRDGSRLAFKIFNPCSENRREEMHLMQPLYPRLQGFLHRLQEP